jgi:hypothetical protein
VGVFPSRSSYRCKAQPHNIAPLFKQSAVKLMTLPPSMLLVMVASPALSSLSQEMLNHTHCLVEKRVARFQTLFEQSSEQ